MGERLITSLRQREIPDTPGEVLITNPKDQSKIQPVITEYAGMKERVDQTTNDNDKDLEIWGSGLIAAGQTTTVFLHRSGDPQNLLVLGLTSVGYNLSV